MGSQRVRHDWATELNWVPWTARRSNQSILKEINPEYLLKTLMLKLKLQYFGQLVWRAVSLEKTLMLGKTEGRKRRGRQRMRWLDSITDSVDMNLSKLQRQWRTGNSGVLQSTVSQSWTWLSDLTTTGVHLPFHGWFVSLSVKPNLGIVDAYVIGTVWSLCS